MDYSDEEWKNIPGFHGRYQASTYGRIKSVRNPRRINHTFVMKPQPRGAGGYLGIGLTDIITGKSKSYFIQVLVALTFLGPKPDRFSQVNHINFDKHDNRISNLEYVTGSENSRHALANGLRKRTGYGRCLLPDEVRDILAIGESVPKQYLATHYGTTFETIRSILLRTRWIDLQPSEPNQRIQAIIAGWKGSQPIQISPDTIRALKQLPHEINHCQAGRMFGVSSSHVSRIRRRLVRSDIN